MAVYRAKKGVFTNYTPALRMSNQVILDGTDPEFLCPKGIFMLESLLGTSVKIEDGNGVTILASTNSFTLDQSPIRCDEGVKFTGTVMMAKGFVLEQVFV